MEFKVFPFYPVINTYTHTPLCECICLQFCLKDVIKEKYFLKKAHQETPWAWNDRGDSALRGTGPCINLFVTAVEG